MDKQQGEVVLVGSDHAALGRKNEVIAWLESHGYSVRDYGTMSEESCDYPDIATPLAKDIAAGNAAKGVLLCGSGLGMCYAANRIAGVRAALCWSSEAAKLSREHNDANILVLPGRVAVMDPWEAILDAWLATPFTGDERHCRRIRKIEGQ